MKKPRIALLVGPTGSGKTTLAVALAKKLNLEVVNGDALQVYRRLDIGTAKPSARLRQLVPHHLIDVLEPDQPLNAAWFADEARKAIASIHNKGKIPLVVGGAGFYLKALEQPPPKSITGPSAVVDDLKVAYEELKKADEVAASRIHPNDRYRISRAMALLRADLKPSVEWARASDQPAAYESVWIGLAWDRKALYDRIDARVIEMFKEGLIDETSGVLRDYPDARTRLIRTIGYRQAVSLLEKTITEKQAIVLSQAATRQYAKRQLTWFRKELRIHWLTPERALDHAHSLLENSVP